MANQSYWLKGHCLVVYCSGGLCPVYILAVLKTKTEKRNSFELRKNWKGKKIVSSWEHLCLPRIALSFSVMVCSHDHNQGCELSRTAKLLNLYQSYLNKVLWWALFMKQNLKLSVVWANLDSFKFSYSLCFIFFLGGTPPGRWPIQNPPPGSLPVARQVTPRQGMLSGIQVWGQMYSNFAPRPQTYEQRCDEKHISISCACRAFVLIGSCPNWSKDISTHQDS